MGAGRVVLVVAEVVGDLAFQRGLQHNLGQLLQQPTLTGQLQPLFPGLGHQLPYQRGIHARRRGLRSTGVLTRLVCRHRGSIRRGRRHRHRVLSP